MFDDVRQEDCKVNKQKICPQMKRMNADEEEEEETRESSDSDFPNFSFPPSVLICVICGQTFLIGNLAIGLGRLSSKVGNLDAGRHH